MEEKKDKTVVGYFLPKQERERVFFIKSIHNALVNVMSIPSGEADFLLLYKRDQRENIEDFLDILQTEQFPATLQHGTIPELCANIIELAERSRISEIRGSRIINHKNLENLVFFALREWIEWSRTKDKK